MQYRYIKFFLVVQGYVQASGFVLSLPVHPTTVAAPAFVTATARMGRPVSPCTCPPACLPGIPIPTCLIPRKTTRRTQLLF